VPEKAQVQILRDRQRSTLNYVADAAKILPSNCLNSKVEDVNAAPFVPAKRPVVQQPSVINDVNEMLQRPNQPADNGELILRTYLDRQGRNEYINLASSVRRK